MGSYKVPSLKQTGLMSRRTLQNNGGTFYRVKALLESGRNFGK